MTFNINELKKTLDKGGGLLKTNRFVVLLTPPRGLGGTAINGIATNTTNSTLRYYAESVSIPGISFQTSEVRRQGIGNLEKMVWGAAFTDCDIRFRIDQKTQNWNFFQTWMNKIYQFNISKGTNFEMEYKNNIATTLSIMVYNEIDPSKPVITIDLYDAFPVSIGDIGLDWGGNDFARLNVRFNFASWNERDTVASTTNN